MYVSSGVRCVCVSMYLFATTDTFSLSIPNSLFIWSFIFLNRSTSGMMTTLAITSMYYKGERKRKRKTGYGNCKIHYCYYYNNDNELTLDCGTLMNQTNGLILTSFIS